jgi:membrane associated rhomboid family serine protease
MGEPVDKALTCVVIVGVVLVTVLAGLGLSGSTIPAFPPALEGWTGWVASVVGIIVSARVLWTVAAWIQEKTRERAVTSRDNRLT